MRSRIILAAALLAGLLSVPAAPAQQSKTAARPVQDDLGMFSAGAKNKANAEIARIKQVHHKDLVIETAHAPKSVTSIEESDKAAINKAAAQWAIEKFKNERIDGVFVLILDKPKVIRVDAGPKTIETGLFTNKNSDELFHKILEKMKAGDNDGALLAATSYVADTMQHHARPAAGNQPAQASNIMYWVLIGLAILLAFWIISAVIRALSGGGGGGRPGYGYGGGGGGGGGFMSSLLGGMFGAAAGMWMYNNFFGHSTPSAWGGDSQTNPTGEPTDVGAGDPSGSGGDYGDVDKGGTEDPGGGDAGGGDWGGGGGDAGGGGDWGGGGGGDWGGGGGDFGGGGGGGDW